MKTFDEIFDECVSQINRGQRLEDCLASYPEHSEELEPLLQAMVHTRKVCAFTPSPEAKRSARQRFSAAMDQLERKRAEKRPLFPRVFGWSGAWAAVTAVLVMALIGYFGIRPALAPVGPGSQPGTQGYLTFLISDEVNAIGDFQSLNVSISKIGLHLAGEDGEWIELDPEVKEVDLTLLQGTKAQSIWSGNITAGRYTKVFIYVDNVWGQLTEAKGGSTVEVKLPSNKLQISKPFEVTDDQETNFVYDLTVVAAGNDRSGIKYVLKPQVAESGADQDFEEITSEEAAQKSGGQGAAGKPANTGRPDNPGKPDRPGKQENALQLQLEGDPALGVEVSLIVTDEGSPLEGAMVTVNGEEVGSTDADGRLPILLPDIPGEVKIGAEAGSRSGELELDLGEQQEQ